MTIGLLKVTSTSPHTTSITAARTIRAAIRNRFANVSVIEMDSMDTSLIVHLLDGKGNPFCRLLDDAGIAYERRPRPVGVILNSGDAIQIATDLAPHATWAAAVAWVIIAWIKSRASRKVTFTTTENEVQHAFEGMSVEEIERLLRVSKSIMVFDTKPNKHDGEQCGEPEESRG